MAGIIGIYGLVVSVLISDGLKQELPLYTGFIQFGAGLSVGLAGLAAGFAIGIVGDAGVRGTAQQPRLFVGMILILIFAEVLGNYGASMDVKDQPADSEPRSLRPHCRPPHELQGHAQRDVQLILRCSERLGRRPGNSDDPQEASIPSNKQTFWSSTRTADGLASTVNANKAVIGADRSFDGTGKARTRPLSYKLGNRSRRMYMYSS